MFKALILVVILLLQLGIFAVIFFGADKSMDQAVDALGKAGVQVPKPEHSDKSKKGDDKPKDDGDKKKESGETKLIENSDVKPENDESGLVNKSKESEISEDDSSKNNSPDTPQASQLVKKSNSIGLVGEGKNFSSAGIDLGLDDIVQ